MSDLRDDLRQIILARGYRRLPAPVQLASGARSQDFIDGKLALAHYPDLHLACRAIVEAVSAAGITFSATGGLTMGADHLAVGVAAVTGGRWFFVRKEPKNRGTGQLVEGAHLEVGEGVLIVEDVITSGGSILKAVDAVEAAGARVVAAATLVDRGEQAAPALAQRGVAYFPMLTYRDLGIEPVGPPS